jgi:hypothetical protein
MKEFFYKYGLVIFLIVSICVFGIQKELEISEIIQKTLVAGGVIPSESVVIIVNLPFGSFPTVINKGLLSPSKEGVSWITLKDFKERMSNRGCKPKIDNKYTFEAREKEKSNAVYKKRG